MAWLLAAALLMGASPQPPSPAPPPPLPGPAGYSVDLWEVDDGLPQNSVISMIQTRDGYLWLGTWAGLVRFDGVRFTPVAEDLANNHILGLAEGPDGSVWIATGGGGVARWRNHVLTPFTTAEGLVDDDARAIVVAPDGRVWVGTTAGVSVIDDGVVKSPVLATGVLPSPRITAMAVDGQGRVLIGTPRGLCTAVALDLSCEGGAAPREAGVAGIAVDGRGRVVLLTADSRLVEWTPSTGERRPLCGDPRCGVARASALGTLGHGTLVVGGAGDTVVIDPGGTAVIVGGLPQGIRTFHEDDEGSIWIGTEGRGLARLRPTRVVTYSTGEGLSAQVTTSIVEDAEGRIWAAGRCGPATVFDGQAGFEPAPREARSSCTVAMLATRDGSLWLGDGDLGLIRWKQGRATRLGREQGLRGGYVRVLFEDRHGALWIAEEGDHFHRWYEGRLTTFGPQEGLRGSNVSAFAEGRDGRLFLGSNAHGLFAFDDGRFRPVGSAALPTRLVSALYSDSRGDLWIGTANQGLYRMRSEDHFEHVGTAQGLPDPVVALMLEDGDANLWVSSSRGITRLLRREIDGIAPGGVAFADPLVLGKADGMRSLEGSGGGFDPSGLRARDGRLWFSTLDGIAVVDPNGLRLNTVPPPVLVEHVTLDDGHRVPVGAGLVRVPAGTQGIEIAYTAFSLIDPSRVRFRYRLAGFESEWHEAGARRSAFYTNLAPATYRFEVLAANNDGVWSRAAAVVQLVVEPLWWQRRPLQLVALALLLLLTAGGARATALRRTRAKIALLEREHALERERSRIARDLHDEIGSRLTYLTLLADASEPAGAREALSDAARDTARTMDELVWSVNAANDTVEGLTAYAVRFAETHARAAGLRCRFTLPRERDPRELTADVRRHLFLAFKEAVNNAVKHAAASEIRVGLHVGHDQLAIEVADDGRGIAQHAEGAAGNGLRNMRERMEAVKGRFELETSPGVGTTVRLSVPLPGT